MTGRNPEAQIKLDMHGLEAFVDDIIDGKSYRAIAKELGIGVSSIIRWLASDSERSARVKQALTSSAIDCDDEALETLKDENIEPARAREIASHLRWRARVRNPREYGDKLEIDQKTTVVNLSAEELQAELDRIRKAREAALAVPAAGQADPWADAEPPTTSEPAP